MFGSHYVFVYMFKKIIGTIVINGFTKEIQIVYSDLDELVKSV